MKCRWVAGTPGHHEGMVNNSVHGNNYLGNSCIVENEAVPMSNVIKFEVQVITLIAIIYIAFRLNEMFNSGLSGNFFIVIYDQTRIVSQAFVVSSHS